MNFRTVHCIGAGGIGVSALAKWFLAHGAEVTGSDATESEITKELEAQKIPVVIGHEARNIPPKADCVIYSSAVPEDNMERVEATHRGIPLYSYFEMLGELSRNHPTIAIAGTHGKSTTTALVGLFLEAAGFDPTVIVGSKVKTFPQGNLRVGKGDWWVVEACEHMANMRHLAPTMIVLTNLEADHLDFYRDLQHIQETFQKWIQTLPAHDGKFVYNADDEPSVSLQAPCARISYGINEPADVRASAPRLEGGERPFQQSEIYENGLSAAELTLYIPGIFNMRNALAAFAVGKTLGIKNEVMVEAVKKFTGLWRRFEIVSKEPLVISDYAHHPTAIRATLDAVHAFYPKRRLMVVFQPHQKDRTKKLFHEFVESLDGADALVIAEIYGVTGRDAGPRISSRKLVQAIQKRNIEQGQARPVYFATRPETARIRARKLIKPGDVALVMGAGDIYQIASTL